MEKLEKLARRYRMLQREVSTLLWMGHNSLGKIVQLEDEYAERVLQCEMQECERRARGLREALGTPTVSVPLSKYRINCMVAQSRRATVAHEMIDVLNRAVRRWDACRFVILLFSPLQ